MSEESMSYKPENGPTLSEISRRPCARIFTDPLYAAPTHRDVRDLMEATGWQGNFVAAVTGVSSSRVVRKWRANPEETNEARSIPYAAWRLLLIEAGVVSEVRSNQAADHRADYKI